MRRILTAPLLLLGLSACHAETEGLRTPDPSEPEPLPAPGAPAEIDPEVPDPTWMPEGPAPGLPPLLIWTEEPQPHLQAFELGYPDTRIQLTPSDPSRYGLGASTRVDTYWEPGNPPRFDVTDGVRRVRFEAQIGAEPRPLRTRDEAGPYPLTSADDRYEVWLEEGAVLVRELQPGAAATRYEAGLSRGSWPFVWKDSVFGILEPTPAGHAVWAVRPGRGPVALGETVRFDEGVQVRAEHLLSTTRTNEGYSMRAIGADGGVRTFEFVEMPRINQSYGAVALVEGWGPTGPYLSAVDLSLGTRVDFGPGISAAYSPLEEARLAAALEWNRYGAGSTLGVVDLERMQLRTVGQANLRHNIVVVNEARDELLLVDAFLGGIDIRSLEDGAPLAFWPTPQDWFPRQLSDDGRWLLVDVRAYPFRSAIVDLQTGATTEFEEWVIGLFDRYALLEPSSRGGSLRVLGTGQLGRALLTTESQSMHVRPVEGSDRWIAETEDGTFHLIDPRAPNPGLWSAALPGHELLRQSGERLWFQRRIEDGYKLAVLDSGATPPTLREVEGTHHSSPWVWEARQSLIVPTHPGFVEVDSTGAVHALDLDIGDDAQPLFVPSDEGGLWLQDGDTLVRVSAEGAASVRATELPDGYPRVHVAGAWAYVVFHHEPEVSVYVMRVEGETTVAALPPEAGWFWSDEVSYFSHETPPFDPQGRLLVITEAGLEAFGPRGVPELIFSTNDRPLTGVTSDGARWFASADGGLWIGGVGEPRWVSVPDAVGSNRVDRLSERYYRVWGYGGHYLLDVEAANARPIPPGRSLSHHAEGSRFVAYDANQPVVWDVDVDRLYPLAPRSARRTYVLDVLR